MGEVTVDPATGELMDMVPAWAVILATPIAMRVSNLRGGGFIMSRRVAGHLLWLCKQETLNQQYFESDYLG
jgi:hypothetical protein